MSDHKSMKVEGTSEIKPVEIPEFRTIKDEFETSVEKVYQKYRDDIVMDLVNAYKGGKRSIDLPFNMEKSEKNYIGSKMEEEFRNKNWEINYEVIDSGIQFRFG